MAPKKKKFKLDDDWDDEEDDIWENTSGDEYEEDFSEDDIDKY